MLIKFRWYFLAMEDLPDLGLFEKRLFSRFGPSVRLFQTKTAIAPLLAKTIDWQLVIAPEQLSAKSN